MTNGMITIKGIDITVSRKDDKAVWMVYDECLNIIAHGTTELLRLVETTIKSETVYEVNNVQIIISKQGSE